MGKIKRKEIRMRKTTQIRNINFKLALKALSDKKKTP